MSYPTVVTIGNRMSKQLPDNLLPDLEEIQNLERPTFRLVKAKDLIIPQEKAQRVQELKHIVKMITKGFSWPSVGVLPVRGPLENGKYVLVDGGHRSLLAFLVHGKDPELELPVSVTPAGKDYLVEAAEQFEQDNSVRLATHEVDHHKVGRTRKNPADLYCDRFFKELGIRITKGAETNEEFSGIKDFKKIMCPKSGNPGLLHRDRIEAIDNRNGDRARRVFQIYQRVFQDHPIQGRHFGGMMLALWATEDFYGVSTKEIIKVLKDGIQNIYRARALQKKRGPTPIFSPRILNGGMNSYSGTNWPINAIVLMEAWNASSLKPFGLKRSDIDGCIHKVGTGHNIGYKYVIQPIRKI